MYKKSERVLKVKKKLGKSPEEKKKEVEDLLSKLQEGVINFKYEPEVYKAILEMQALMPSYSFRNLMLLHAQNSTARYVASFNHWKKLERNVKKGSKALRILAPRFARERDENTGSDEQKLIGFVSVPVFDVSQTEGKELPIEKHKLELKGDSEIAGTIYDAVVKVAAADNCRVTLGDGEGANGYYSRLTHSIVIEKSNPPNQRAKTAVHELVHSKVHRSDYKSSKEEKECVAEGVAFIVCSYFGFDTSDYSFGYVQSWSSDNGESLLKYGEIIQKTAASIILEFEALISPSSEEADVTVESSNDTTVAVA